jgi:uncharacterized protein YfaS (alpha-2-macroglobulin family)
MPLSLATQAWLARQIIDVPNSDAAAQNASVAVTLTAGATSPAQLVLARSSNGTTTRFLSQDELANAKLIAKNDGTTPVKVTLFVRGLPRQTAPIAQSKTLSRTFYDADGMKLDPTSLKLKQNDLVYVVIEGRSPGYEANAEEDEHAFEAETPPEEGEAQEPAECRSSPHTKADLDTAVIDLLPAGLRIVSRDVYRTTVAQREVASPHSLPCGIGEVRQAEGRVDSFVGVVRANKKGRFRIGYAVRAETVGDFVYPALRVEAMARPGDAEQTASPARISIEAR